MCSNTTAAWGKNGTQPMHTDSVSSSSPSKNNGRKSLLERLKPDTPPQTKHQPDAARKEPQYLDVTAAFFGRHRRQAPQVKNATSTPSQYAKQQQQQQSMPPPPLPRHQGSSSLERPLQKQKPRDPPEEPRTPDAPSTNELRKELDQNIAAEGSQIYSNGTTRLNGLYDNFKSAVDDISKKNDHILVQALSQNKNIIKPFAEMSLKETLVGNDGGTTSRQIHVGKQIQSIYSTIKALEAEVGQLWEDWEAAEHMVQTILASMTGRGDDHSVDQGGPIDNVQDSLAREMEKYDEELENILKGSHEAVRVSEKEYTKMIVGVMSALLQQYLFGA